MRNSAYTPDVVSASAGAGLQLRTPCRRTRQRGSAMIEAALCFPLLLLIAIGTADFARAVRLGMIVASAAAAGAQYGSQSIAKTADTAGIQQVATQDAVNVTNLTVTSAQVCKCPDGSSVSCTTAINQPATACAAGATPRIYAQVTTSAPYQAIAPYAGIPSSIPIQATTMMRAQ